MSELVPGLSYEEMVAEALRHTTEASFRSSSFYRRHGQALDQLLATPVFAGPATPPGAGLPDRPVPHRPLRVVHWNIEKGKKLGEIADFLAHDPSVRDADVVTLNEVDVGMARSGNADVARVLANRLGCRAVFLPNYLECTKGVLLERLAPGENERGLHGLAVLSRLPIEAVEVHPLPPCWDYFSFHEKRFGGRTGLYLKLDWNSRPLALGTTHLEMRASPACRARQFRAFLRGLDGALARWGNIPAVLTGDWNTHTFRRGSRLASVQEFLRIVGTRPADRLDRDLVAPFQLEPLFFALQRSGFEVAGVNDGEATASQALDSVEDLARFPGWFGRALVGVSGLKGRVLRMRLDWIAVRGLSAAAPPRTIDPKSDTGEPLSDHALVTVDLVASTPMFTAPATSEIPRTRRISPL